MNPILKKTAAGLPSLAAPLCFWPSQSPARTPLRKKPAAALLALPAPFASTPSHAQQAVSGGTMRAAPVASPERSTWATAPTQSISAGGVAFAYRELGKHH